MGLVTPAGLWLYGVHLALLVPAAVALWAYYAAKRRLVDELLATAPKEWEALGRPRVFFALPPDAEDIAYGRDPRAQVRASLRQQRFDRFLFFGSAPLGIPAIDQLVFRARRRLRVSVALIALPSAWTAVCVAVAR